MLVPETGRHRGEVTVRECIVPEVDRDGPCTLAAVQQCDPTLLVSPLDLQLVGDRRILIRIRFRPHPPFRIRTLPPDRRSFRAIGEDGPRWVWALR